MKQLRMAKMHGGVGRWAALLRGIAVACLGAQMAWGEAPAPVGPSTGLPIPRFVSIKASEANVRRGPSTTHRIDWVFKHPGLPVIVTGEYGHWRRVVDRDGLGGWVHYALLSGNRTVIVDVDRADMRRSPSRDAVVEARLERGVIARLFACERDWCEVSADGHKGWAEAAALWGISLRTAQAGAD
jgi:SH3-like domain-containing protein